MKSNAASEWPLTLTFSSSCILAAEHESHCRTFNKILEYQSQQRMLRKHLDKLWCFLFFSFFFYLYKLCVKVKFFRFWTYSRYSFLC